MIKAFENIKLEDSWAAGVHFGFPLRILRLALEAFAFARRLVFQSAITEPVMTLSAILAGGGFAQLSPLLVLIGPLDRMVARCEGRALTFCLYVDDVAAHAAGSATQVTIMTASAIEELVDVVEGELDMRVSRRERWSSIGQGKSVATASSQMLARSLSTPMRRLGVQVKKKAKHLGVTIRPGGKTKEPGGKDSRWTKNANRRARMMRLGRRLGSHIFRTAVAPSALYGSSVALPRIGTVREMRRDAARAFGPLLGRSITARLAVNACDPALQVIKKAIAYWTEAVWDESVLDATLRYAWKFACCNAIRSQRPSVTAGGAAGAFIAAIDRIEWKSPAPDSVQTRDGTVLNLRDVAPYTVAQ